MATERKWSYFFHGGSSPNGGGGGGLKASISVGEMFHVCNIGMIDGEYQYGVREIM